MFGIHVDSDDKTTALIQGSGSNYKTQAVVINEPEKWTTGTVLLIRAQGTGRTGPCAVMC